MKSAIEWFKQLKVPFDGDVTIQDFILIQDDAREDLLTRIKSLEDQNAKLREALEKAIVLLQEGLKKVSDWGLSPGDVFWVVEVQSFLSINSLELEPKD